MMDTHSYWALLDSVCREAGITDRCDIGVDPDAAEAMWTALYAVFSQLPEAEAGAVYRHTDTLMRQANTAGLVAAAYVIHGTVTDDCFEYFREWLILQGQTVYAQAVQNPDSLAHYFSGKDPKRVYAQFEGIKATLNMLVNERDYDADAFYAGTGEWEPAVEIWDDAQTARMLPRLVALLGV